MKTSRDSSGFVLITDVVPEVLLDVRYYSAFNFIGERIEGYEKPTALLTKEAAAALKKVSDELIPAGLRLRIYDAYRPQSSVDRFVRWANDPLDVRMKEYFYPYTEKKDVIPSGYIFERSGHSRGSTVDLTLFDAKTGRELDMGGPFDFFGELSHPDFEGVTREQHENRMLLRRVMVKHGFEPLDEEWWHFTLKNEPFPDTYFDFPVNESSVKRK